MSPVSSAPLHHLCSSSGELSSLSSAKLMMPWDEWMFGMSRSAEPLWCIRVWWWRSQQHQRDGHTKMAKVAESL